MLTSSAGESFVFVHPHDALRSVARDRYAHSPQATEMHAAVIAGFTDAFSTHHLAEAATENSRMLDDPARRALMSEELTASAVADIRHLSDSPEYRRMRRAEQFETAASYYTRALPHLATLRDVRDLRNAAAICELLIEHASVVRCGVSARVEGGDAVSPSASLAALHASPLVRESYITQRRAIEVQKADLRYRFSHGRSSYEDSLMQFAQKGFEQLLARYKFDEAALDRMDDAALRMQVYFPDAPDISPFPESPLVKKELTERYASVVRALDASVRLEPASLAAVLARVGRMIDAIPIPAFRLS